MNISLNLKAIESIKGSILTEVAGLYNILADYDDTDAYEEILGKLSGIIAMEYILGRRLGINYHGIDKKISEILNSCIENGHEIETEFSDMSELDKYILNR